MILNGAFDSDRNIYRLNGFVATDGNQLIQRSMEFL